MKSVVSMPSLCQESAVKEDFLATLNQMEGSYTEVAIAPPGTSKFTQAYYFKIMTGATLSFVLKKNCNVSFASGLINLPGDISEGKLQKRIGSDQYISQKNIISFDIDFKSFVPDYAPKDPNKEELVNKIFEKIKHSLDQCGFPLWLGAFSGNGIHLHFKLKNPVSIESKTQYTNIYEAILGYLSCQLPELIFDPACKNPSRLMRLPFSTNWKDATYPIACQILFHNSDADFEPIYEKFKGTIAYEVCKDKKSVLSKLTLVKILDHFNYSKKQTIYEKGSKIICSSPFSEDKTPSFYCDLNKNVFYDFSTSTGGDYFTLIAKLANLDITKGFPKVINIAKKIAGIEEKAVSSSQFFVDAKGVWFHPHVEAEKEWLSSPIYIEALTRDNNSQTWGRLLSFKDQDGISKTWSMPMDLLAGDGIEVRRQLLNLGLQLAFGKRERSLFLSYLQSSAPQKRIKCIERMGWNKACFILPRETISSNPDHEHVVLQMQIPKDEILTSGTLEEWQEHIGSKCVGNSRLILSVCAALASPLVKESGLENGGFHLVGQSSIGKSIALKVAASVWGNPGLNGFIKRWRATVNGLELLALSRCDSLLILDELGEMQPKDAGLAAYVLSSGQSKSRSNATRTLIDPKEWRLLFLSSGEIGLSSHINSEGGQVRAGQEIRLVDIPAEAENGFGLFENIHSSPTANHFATELNQKAEVYYGALIVAFLNKLVSDQDSFYKVSELRKSFTHSLNIANSHGQIHRVAQRFSLLAAAGELAIEYGILAWPKGEALRGCHMCFEAWKSNWGGDSNKESRQIIQQIRKIFQEYGPSRFPVLDDLKQASFQGVLWGFRKSNPIEGIDWLVLNEVFRKELCRGFEFRSVIKALKEFDLLEISAEQKTSSTIRVPFLGLTRVVTVKSKILE